MENTNTISSFTENSIRKGLINGPHIMFRRTTMQHAQFISAEDRSNLLLKIIQTVEGEKDTVGPLEGQAALIFRNLMEDMKQQDAKWSENTEKNKLRSKIMNEAKRNKALQRQQELEQLKATVTVATVANPNHQGTIKEPTRNHQGTIKEPNTIQNNSTQTNSFSTESKITEPLEQSATSQQPISSSQQQVSSETEKLRAKILYNETTIMPSLNDPVLQQNMQSEIDNDKARLAELEGGAVQKLETATTDQDNDSDVPF